MKTELINIAKDKEYAKQRAVYHLQNGDMIGFPTETVYGVGCNIFNIKAIEKIYELKSRSNKKPLSAHIGHIDDVERLCKEIPGSFYILAEKFLPGPLAVILKKKEHIPDIATAGLSTIGIRFPDHESITEIIRESGAPVAGTSANISGSKHAISGKEVMSIFDGKLPLILDDGETKYARESTVISLCEETPVCFREGEVKIEQLEELLSVRFL